MWSNCGPCPFFTPHEVAGRSSGKFVFHVNKQQIQSFRWPFRLFVFISVTRVEGCTGMSKVNVSFCILSRYTADSIVGRHQYVSRPTNVRWSSEDRGRQVRPGCVSPGTMMETEWYALLCLSWIREEYSTLRSRSRLARWASCRGCNCARS